MKKTLGKPSILLILMLLALPAYAKKQATQYKWRSVPIPAVIDLRDSEKTLKADCANGSQGACEFLADYPQQYEADELCGKLIKELNSYQFSPDNNEAKAEVFKKNSTSACAMYVIANYSGFEEDNKIKLNIQDHRQLLYEFKKFDSLGENYFKGIMDKTTFDNRSTPDKLLWESVDRFIGLNGQLSTWQMPLPRRFYRFTKDIKDLHDTKQGYPPLRVIDFYFNNKEKRQFFNKTYCPNFPTDKWNNLNTSFQASRIVTEDLKKPDPRLENYGFQQMDRKNYKIYKDRLYAISAGSANSNYSQYFGILISSFDLKATAPGGVFCNIVYAPVKRKGK